MAHRAAPISVSIALGHASANAVKATAGGWSTGSSASLTFPLHSHMSSARREGSEYHFNSLWYDSAGARTHDLPAVRQTLYHWAIHIGHNEIWVNKIVLTLHEIVFTSHSGLALFYSPILGGVEGEVFTKCRQFSLGYYSQQRTDSFSFTL